MTISKDLKHVGGLTAPRPVTVLDTKPQDTELTKTIFWGKVRLKFFDGKRKQAAVYQVSRPILVPCPRCSGQLVRARDRHGEFVYCLQCGGEW